MPDHLKQRYELRKKIIAEYPVPDRYSEYQKQAEGLAPVPTSVPEE